MGQYCCCEWKMTPSYVIDCVNNTHTIYEVDEDGCKCDWTDWNSVYDWPPQRKNKEKPFLNPKKDGIYNVRIQGTCGDRYEDESSFYIIPRTIKCRYTGEDISVHWSGNEDEQPYAWKEKDDE